MVSPQVLYEKAKRENIPFYKWHIWIESQFNSMYVQEAYKTDTKIKSIKLVN